MITADALHTQREHAQFLARKKAHYILVVKKNQPSLYAQVKNPPWRNIPAGDRQRGRGHGRDEHRTLKAATVAAGLAFPHAAQAIRVTRRIRPLSGGRKWRTFTIYAITSLTAAQATDAQLAGWIRGHWQIEVLHHIRSLGVLELLHDVALERFTERFCNTSATCGACCRRCSEPCWRWTCNICNTASRSR